MRAGLHEHMAGEQRESPCAATLLRNPSALVTMLRHAQAEDTSVAAMQEHVARAAGVPGRRQFLVVAEERARGASLGHLAKRMQARARVPM